MAARADETVIEPQCTVIVNPGIQTNSHQGHYVNYMIRSSTTEEDGSDFVNTCSPLGVQQYNKDEPIYDDNMTTKRPLQPQNNEETNNHDTMSNHDDETDGEDLPELTAHHLFNVFFNSGITFEDVNTLRVMLHIARDRLPNAMSDYPSTSCPATAHQAMETVLAWINLHPEISLKEKHRILEEHLRRLRLNCIIPRLHGQERLTETDPQKITDYLSEVSRTFSTKQAYEFGRSLKLSKRKIDTISRNTGAKRGMDLVLQIFEHINRNNTHLKGSLVDDIQESLFTAAKTMTNEREETLKHHKGCHDRAGCNASEDSFCSNKEKTNKGKSFCAVILIVVAILLIIFTLCTIGFLTIFPQVLSLPKQVIVPSDVVLYTIPSSYWINTISIELEGPTGCSAEVISVKCNDVQYFNDSVIKFIDEFDYLYINKDSSIQFILSTETDSATPYYAWIFTDLQSAVQHSAINFEDLACNDPPDGVWCIRLSENERFVTPSSSYYFIRCDRGPNCTLVESIEVNTREFDFESTRTYEIDSVVIQGHNDEQELIMKSSPFNPLPVEDDACLLMTLNDDCKTRAPQVAITGREGRYELLLYLVLFLIMWNILLISSIIILKCRLNKTVHKSNLN